jgi:serine/threonine-protein kinase HipA
MNRCPITYELVNNQKYSENGLRLLSKSLQNLKDFPFTPREQIQMAAEYVSKLSIQGVQPKLSVKLNVKKEMFEAVEKKGTYIIKPPHHLYDEVPQNEDLTMRLAKIVGIEVPFHGMLYNVDGSLGYFIKRFDRVRNQKIAIEDFSQLLGYSRDTKYESSMEKVISVIDKHCTFPMVEKLKLFRIVIFNFIVGNEDMHLKNFSLIRLDGKVSLSPTYDLLNTTIIMKGKEEIVLPLAGRKRNLIRENLVDYFGERLGISKSVLEKELLTFKNSLSKWKTLIDNSFLSEKMQDSYKKLIEERSKRLNLL